MSEISTPLLSHSLKLTLTGCSSAVPVSVSFEYVTFDLLNLAQQGKSIADLTGFCIKTVVSTDKPISKGYQARSRGAERSEKSMSEYAILRFAKLPKNGNVAGSVRHITRERDTPNADPLLRDQNSIEGGQNVSDLMGQFRNRLPEKVRKNGVRAIECLVTASPEKMDSMTRQEQDDYFEDAKKWVAQNFGGEQNIFCTAIHRDEKTPHMHVLLVPMNDKGKLSASTYLDGGAKLRALQTDFAESVGEKYGLKRGIEGSKAKHQTIQKYYAKLDKSRQTEYKLKAPRMLKKGLIVNKVENKQDVIDRVSSQAAGLISEMEQRNAAIESVKKTAQNLNQQLHDLQPVRDLGHEDRERLLEHAKKMKEKRRLEAQQRMAERRAKRLDKGSER